MVLDGSHAQLGSGGAGLTWGVRHQGGRGEERAVLAAATVVFTAAAPAAHRATGSRGVAPDQAPEQAAATSSPNAQETVQVSLHHNNRPQNFTLCAKQAY